MGDGGPAGGAPSEAQGEVNEGLPAASGALQGDVQSLVSGGGENPVAPAVPHFSEPQVVAAAAPQVRGHICQNPQGIRVY